MATLPVFCDNCGAVWGARNVIGGSGGTHIAMTNVAVGPCPNCGGTGGVPDGVYDLMDDTLTVVQSAGLPKGTLQSLIGVLESLNRGEVTADEVTEQVEDEAPELAPIVNVYLQKPDRARWIVVLIAILGLLMQGPGTVNEVSELLHTQPGVPGGAHLPAASSRRAPKAKASAKRKRPGKSYGKNKGHPTRGSKKRR
jgi:hypothetical protein